MTSQAADAQPGPGRLCAAAAVRDDRWTAPGLRRRLQLVLAGIWLLDALLQFQAVMFSRSFAQMLAGTGPGNPAIIAGPVSWAARIIAANGTVTDALFAAIQLVIALGIAWRPTVRPALAASIGWAVAVWWLGEGLGGVLNGTGSPVNGAPGAVILYALLAVLLWPAAPGRPGPFAAAGATGAAAARVLWLVLWGSLAALALLPATRAPKAFGAMVAGLVAGQPGWLAGLDRRLGAFLAGHGPAAAGVLAAVLAVVAVSAWLPARLARAGVALAVAAAAFLWVCQGLGGILTGAGTDPNSGLLLALIAVAFWPREADPAAVADSAAAAGTAAAGTAAAGTAAVPAAAAADTAASPGVAALFRKEA